MEVNKIIRALREDHEPHLSQAALAEALGMTQRKISRLETGETEPNVSDMQKYCRYFGVSADYLLGLPANLSYPKR